MSDTYSLWVLEPHAQPDDPLWQDRPIWSKVIVVAESPAFARLAAAHWAARDVAGPGNESPSPVIGFEDERLYAVRKLRPGEPVCDDLAGAVISAESSQHPVAAADVSGQPAH
jgi:hypothetical protein